MPIRDIQLRKFVNELEQSPGRKVDDSNVLKLLAAVGDRSDADSLSLLQKLSGPDISREQQLEIAKQGLDDTEREGVRQILETYELSPGACNFLEALLGLADLGVNHGPLVLLGKASGELRGTAGRGDTVEAINLSTAAASTTPTDAMATFKTRDDYGWFIGEVGDVKEGDQLRVRTRHRDGTVSNWVDIRASGIADKDERNAIVNVENLRFVVKDDGGLDLLQDSKQPVSEPGAQLRFRNARTGDTLDCKVDNNGHLPAGLNLPGKAGDEIRVAASDGTNNKNLDEICRVLTVPKDGEVNLSDPGPTGRRMGASSVNLKRYTGPLYIDGPVATDVKQGSIGDCYFPASMAAVAHHNAQAIKDAITDNGDGTYTIKFYEPGYEMPRRRVAIEIDGDLYGSYSPSYGKTTATNTTDAMELWFPLIEKAYAKWKGSYQTLDNGGWTGDAMAAVTGGIDTWDDLKDVDADKIFARIQQGVTAGWPMAASTYGKDQSSLYSGTGLYANHAYSVLGCEEKDGERYVQLRNPWGSSEPGRDGKNDGIFLLEVSKFMKLYEDLCVISDETDNA